MSIQIHFSDAVIRYLQQAQSQSAARQDSKFPYCIISYKNPIFL